MSDSDAIGAVGVVGLVGESSVGVSGTGGLWRGTCERT